MALDQAAWNAAQNALATAQQAAANRGAVVVRLASYNAATGAYTFMAQRVSLDTTFPQSFAWSAEASNWGAFTASVADFGGVWPRGVGTIPAGQTSTTFTVTPLAPVFPE